MFEPISTVRFLLVVIIFADFSTSNSTISCYDRSIVKSGFRLCAIRVLTSNDPTIGRSQVTNGLWAGGSIRRWINERNCSNFSTTMDIGYSSCNVAPYETALTVSLCICNRDECNENLEMCRGAVAGASAPSTTPPLGNLAGNLSMTVECAAQSNSSLTCMEHALINVSACESYVQQNSRLCVHSRSMGRLALLNEYSDLYLDQVFYRLQMPSSGDTLFINHTENHIYLRSNSPSPDQMIEECLCKRRSSCNANLSSCLASRSLTPSQSTSISSTPMVAVEHEKGLGQSAIAGITCGIVIFTLIVVIEVIVLKRIF